MNLNLNLSSVKSVAITEHRPISEGVSRVIATTVGTMNSADITARIQTLLDNKAAPIRASFRWLEPGRSAVGYVRAMTPVRAYDASKMESGFTRVTANLLMDKSDESIWQIKNGAGGSYLARTGNDNLSELLEASRMSPRGNTPRMSNVMSASAQKTELVAFVDVTSGEMDYGFCVERRDDYVTVLSSVTNLPVAVKPELVAGVYAPIIPANINAALSGQKPTGKGVTAAKNADTDAQIDYYKRLYSYAPEYLEKVIREIEEMAAL